MGIPIVVISLPAATERRRTVACQLDAAGLTHRVVDAVRGDDAVSRRLIESCDVHRWLVHTGRLPTVGEIGCFASHRLAWQECLLVGRPVLVMEDDFWLLPGFARSIDWVASIASDCGFIRRQSETRARKRLVAVHWEFRLWRYVKAPDSMMCYVIAPRVAKVFLEHTIHICDSVDVFVKRYWHHGQLLYGMTPHTVTESALSSISHIERRTTAKRSFQLCFARLLTKVVWNFRQSAIDLTIQSTNRGLVPTSKTDFVKQNSSGDASD